MYNKVVELIKSETNAFQSKIFNKPRYLFKRDLKFKKNKICVDIAQQISNRIKEPWILKEELESLYNKPIKSAKTSCRNIYYTNDDIKIYSSIKHESFYMDEDYNMYIQLILGHSGDIYEYYNPYFEIKLNLLAPITMLTLTSDKNEKINFNLNRYVNIKIKDRNRIKLY